MTAAIAPPAKGRALGLVLIVGTVRRNMNGYHHQSVGSARVCPPETVGLATGLDRLARRHGSSPTCDMIVAATLLALLVVAIATRAAISNEIADSNVDRPSYVAFMIEFVATLGLSIGLACLLFSSRPRPDRFRRRQSATLLAALSQSLPHRHRYDDEVQISEAPPLAIRSVAIPSKLFANYSM
jgi:hypothetical protein